MKAQKKLSIVLILLIIILISIISFVGIFYQNKNEMDNVVPDYKLGADLSGYRRIVLVVDDDDEENTEDVLNYDNYVKSANIIKERLRSMKVQDFTVRCDETTGQIEITIPEDTQTEYILADITQKGKFEIQNNSNKEVLMNNDDIKSTDVKVQQSSYNTSYYQIYMDINFNGKGAKKFKNITAEYQNTVTNDTSTNYIAGTSTANSTSTNETVNETTNEASNETSEEFTEETDDTIEVGLYIDGTEMMSTSFDEVIDNGVMSLTLGSATSTESRDILKYQAESLAAILENDPMPIQYSITGNLYISSPIEQSTINILIIVGICIAIVMFIVAIVTYKLNGLAISICSVGFIALYLLILRYTNVIITLEGIFSIGLVFVINYLFNIMILNRLQKNIEKTFSKAITKFSLSMIPMLILAVVCCFSSWMSLFSFGMILFWGLVTSIVYNVLLTRIFLKCINSRK